MYLAVSVAILVCFNFNIFEVSSIPAHTRKQNYNLLLKLCNIHLNVNLLYRVATFLYKFFKMILFLIHYLKIEILIIHLKYLLIHLYYNNNHINYLLLH